MMSKITISHPTQPLDGHIHRLHLDSLFSSRINILVPASLDASANTHEYAFPPLD